MTYNVNYFLRPLGAGDRNIQILDSTGVIKYTVNPFSIVNTMVNNNLVKINLKNDKIIFLNFYNSNEAKSAITQLQTQIDTLTQNTPIVIAKDVENYITGLLSDLDINTISPNGEELTLNGDFLPGTNSTYNLGSPQLQWRSLYVGTSSIYIGGLTLSSHNNSLVVNSVNLGSVDNPFVLSTDGDTLLYNSTQSLPISYNNLQGIPFTFIDTATISTDNSVQFNSSLSIVESSVNFISGITPSSIISSNIDENNNGYISIQTIGSASNFDLQFKNGNIILPTVGDIIRDNQSVLYRYSGTSSSHLQLPEEGFIIELQTQDRLGFKQAHSLIVYNIIDNNYAVDDYVDDAGIYFVGEVTGYNFETGLLELVVNYSPKFGATNNDGVVPTYSFWNIEISPSNFSSTLTMTNASNNSLVTSDGSTGLVAHNNLLFDGTQLSIQATTQFQQTIEVVNSSTASTTIDYDFNLGSVWYHNDLGVDYDANFINIPTTENRTITVTIIIAQGATAYLPTVVIINGVSQTIKWSNATPPTGTPNQTDIIGLSFINIGGTFVEILGNISTFG